MNFYSSLSLFYPGKPPVVAGERLRLFCEELRARCGVKPESKCALEIKWGRKIDKDYKDTNVWKMVPGMNLSRAVPYRWSIEKMQLEWADMFHKPYKDRKNVYRAFINLGDLEKEAYEALFAENPDDFGSYISLDGLSVEINPFAPMTLVSEQKIIMGLISISFSGPGYFSWGRDYAEYIEQYKNAMPVKEALGVCRKHFPVPQSEILEKTKAALGDIWWNKDFYNEGDWLLAIDETG